MAYTYEQVYQRAIGQTRPYFSLVNFNGELVTYDYYSPVHNEDGQILHSPDGDTWSQLVNIDHNQANIFSQSYYDGYSLTVYDGSLWISQYNGTSYARILEWDGSSITTHLTSVSQNNNLSYGLIVWGGYLWCITDVTPFYDDNPRRVIYRYSRGTGWTAIGDYDGATYLAYNCPSPHNLDYHIRPSGTRLFIFNGGLYLIATHWNSGTSEYGWQVWKFNIITWNSFNLLYETHDDYVLSGIQLFGSQVLLFANQVDSGGSPQDEAKFYSSYNLTTWAEDGTDDALGFVFSTTVFKGQVFLNCWKQTNNYARIYSYSPALNSAALEEEITTLASDSGTGGAIAWESDLYIGKSEEVMRRTLTGTGGGGGGEGATKKKPFILTKWKFKKPDGTTADKYYSEIDTRSPSVFYDGRILNISPMQRSIDDHTGMYSIADMTIVLSNMDKEFSKLMAEYFLKGQLVEIYHGWADDPADPQVSSVVQMIVQDYHLEGSRFVVQLRDVSKKYFDRTVPFYLAT